MTVKKLMIIACLSITMLFAGSYYFNRLTEDPIEEGSCILIAEASSSKTAFFSFSVKRDNNNLLYLEKNKIADHSHYTVLGARADEYANALNNKTAAQYVDDVLFNKTILDHIQNSSCQKFHWALLSTGGMRNKVSKNNSTKFYDKISMLFKEQKPMCLSDQNCKKIILKKIKTITGAKEGRFAWLTVNKIKNISSFAITDVGGETMQFADKSQSYSWSLGIDRALRELSSNQSCHRSKHKTLITYDGEKCRNSIEKFLDTYDLVQINYDDYDKIFGISNFSFYFYTLCDTYFADVKSRDLIISEPIYKQISNICKMHERKEQFEIQISAYKEISDAVCNHTNKNWDLNDKKYAFVDRMCLVGNYNYSLLKKMDLKSHHSHHIIPHDHGLEQEEGKDRIYINDFAWDTGAAQELLEGKID